MTTPTALCDRCGVRRTVKPERESTGLCGDCIMVERDLAVVLCGTPRGYYLHLRERTVPCDACLDGMAPRWREDNRRRFGYRPRMQAKCGTDSGYYRHRRKRIPFPEDEGGEPCGCRAAHAADKRERAWAKGAKPRYVQREEAA